MGARDDVYGFQGLRVVVDLSQIVGVTISAYQNASIIKYYSGGSLEIGGASLTWGQGYLFSGGEALSIQSSGTYYLVATGATVIAMVLKGKTSGFE